MAKIQVVDDDLMLCEMLVEQLVRVGHVADSVSTLSDALNQVVKDDYDVIFLDVQLPDGNSLETNMK